MLSVRNLSVDYGKRQIIDALSVQILKPNFVVICGHNGCGKTSLFNAIRKKINFSGDISHPDIEFGFLTQFNNVGFPISVEQLLLMGKFRTKHFTDNYSQSDKNDCISLLDRVKMRNYMDYDFSKLSGGEQQLVWILQTIIQDLPAYFFDEPTQHLDIKNKKLVFSLLEEIVSKNEKLVLCITHDLANLINCKGLLLNLSKDEPKLEEISPEVILENIKFLESN